MSSELVCADLSGAHVTIVCMTASACSASPVPRCNCGISELMMFTLKCVSVCVCVCVCVRACVCVCISQCFNRCSGILGFLQCV